MVPGGHNRRTLAAMDRDGGIDMKRKVVEYVLLKTDDAQELTMSINHLISEGWELKGRLQIYKGADYSRYFVQAMVRYE